MNLTITIILTALALIGFILGAGLTLLMYWCFSPPKESSIGEDPMVKAGTGLIVQTKFPSEMGDPVRRAPQKANKYSANWSADRSPGLDGWEQPIVSEEPPLQKRNSASGFGDPLL